MTLQRAEVKTNYDSIFWAYPWIEKYRLFVSLPGRESYALSWTQVHEPSRPPPPPPPRPQIFPH